MTFNDYDEVAKAYSDHNDTSLGNAHYERPATLNLIGDVAGKHVLDAGCGSGPLMAKLQDAGATVSGFDVSTELIRIAEGRLGTDADLHVADIAGRFPHDDNTFDAAACSLVLHYFNDWSAPLAEFRRVLKPGGRLIVSVNHPMVYQLNYPDHNYFDHTQHVEYIKTGDFTFPITCWHRPLHDLCADLTHAGYAITAIEEPAISPDTPDELVRTRVNGQRRFPMFLFFAAQAPTE